MNKKLIIGIVVVLVVAAGIVTLVATRSGDSNKTNSSDNSMAGMDMSGSGQSEMATKPVATDAVAIKDFAFSPANITVKAGSTVTWTNQDSTTHTVTADTSSSDAPDSGNIAPGKSYSFTFQKAGTYMYHCALHPNMVGMVTVQ
jgi:plastocyanin